MVTEAGWFVHSSDGIVGNGAQEAAGAPDGGTAPSVPVASSGKELSPLPRDRGAPRAHTLELAEYDAFLTEQQLVPHMATPWSCSLHVPLVLPCLVLWF